MCKSPGCLVWRTWCAVLAPLFLADAALGYVGPAADPSFLGYFLSMLAFLGVAGSALLLWPIHTLRRWWRGVPPAPPQTEELPAPAPPATPGEPGA